MRSNVVECERLCRQAKLRRKQCLNYSLAVPQSLLSHPAWQIQMLGFPFCGVRHSPCPEHARGHTPGSASPIGERGFDVSTGVAGAAEAGASEAELGDGESPLRAEESAEAAAGSPPSCSAELASATRVSTITGSWTVSAVACGSVEDEVGSVPSAMIGVVFTCEIDL
jgi:hypothetical protein